MRVDTIIGIDCGVSGAIAVKFREHRKVHKMPKELTEVNELLKYYKGISNKMLVVIEKVQIIPHDVNTTDKKKFGRAFRVQKLLNQYNQFIAIMEVGEIPYITVTARSWISYLNLKTPKDWDRTKRKRHYRDFAQQFWPERLSIPLGDAVCLLIWLERKLKYDPDFELPKQLKERMI
jgi:hypothetical protein